MKLPIGRILRERHNCQRRIHTLETKLLNEPSGKQREEWNRELRDEKQALRLLTI